MGERKKTERSGGAGSSHIDQGRGQDEGTVNVGLFASDENGREPGKAERLRGGRAILVTGLVKKGARGV